MNYFNIIDDDIILYILRFINKNYSFIIHSIDHLFKRLTPCRIVIMPMNLTHESPQLADSYIERVGIKNENLLMKMYLYSGRLDKCNSIYYSNFYFSPDIIYESLISGKIDMVTWVDSKIPLCHLEYMYPVVRYGYFDILLYLLNKGLEPDERVIWNAIDSNHFGMVKFLLSRECPLSNFEKSHAIRKGNKYIIMLISNYRYKYGMEQMKIACEIGDIEIVKLLMSYGLKLDTECFNIVVKGNYGELIRLMIEEGVEINNWALYNTIYYCDIENIEIMCNKYKLITFCYEAAFMKKSLELCKYIYKHGVPFDHKIFANAILMCNMSIWEWLYINKCPYGVDCYNTAIMINNLDAIKYLESIKCNFNSKTLKIAIKYSNVDILLYFLKIMRGYNNILRREDIKDIVERRNDPQVTYMVYDFIKI